MSSKSPLSELGVTYIQVDVNKHKRVYAMVDGDYDGEYLSGLKWRLVHGYVMVMPTIRRNNPGMPLYLHQFILPPRKGYWTHFKNGNQLDCRSENLEYLTPKELIRNFRPQGKQRIARSNRSSKTYSQYRGVSKMNDYQRSMLRYKPNTKDLHFSAVIKGDHIGFFKTEEEAARAYDARAIKEWGDDAILNFPEEHGRKED